jgi:putative copper export protein
MLPVTLSSVRLFVHVLAATIWVGGQLTLAGLVPGLRSLSPDAPRAVAARFNRIAWPAFGVLVVTGIWNVTAVDPSWDSAYGRTLMLKIAVVAASGASAFVHARARSRAALAAFGAASGLAALGALFLGIQLG